jgi:thiamine pyrophosphate-dependent acetolactate synthase large subunit-like protein
LQKEGQTHIFSISGGHLAPIYDALIDSDLCLEHTRARAGSGDDGGRLGEG